MLNLLHNKNSDFGLNCFRMIENLSIERFYEIKSYYNCNNLIQDSVNC